jgi:hypothetical protein
VLDCDFHFLLGILRSLASLALPPATFRNDLLDVLGLIHGTQNASNSAFRPSSYSDVKITDGMTPPVDYSLCTPSALTHSLRYVELLTGSGGKGKK